MNARRIAAAVAVAAAAAVAAAVAVVAAVWLGNRPTHHQHKVSPTVRVVFRVDGRLNGTAQMVQRRDLAPYCALTADRAEVVVGAGTLAVTTRAALSDADHPWPARRCRTS